MFINISVKEAKTALKKIKLLAPANLKTDDEFMMSRKETVFFMAEELIRMIRQGFAIKELGTAEVWGR